MHTKERSTADIKLVVDNIDKTFTLHNREAVQVEGFKSISFCAYRGELLALTGASGVGKSSILKAIFRTYLTRSGSISFHRADGSVVDLATCSESDVLELRKREIGFVTQFLKVLPRVTAIQAVATPLMDAGEYEKVSLFCAGVLLEQLGIREELFHLSPLTFSGGEQQRVNIARGVIAPKELLLLDEPTASLDEKSADKVLDLLTGLKEQGIAMVGIFHDQSKIDRVADRSYKVVRTHKVDESPALHLEVA